MKNESENIEKTIPINVTIFTTLVALCFIIAGVYFEKKVFCFSFPASLPGLFFADYWHLNLIRFRPLVTINAVWVACGLFISVCVDRYVEEMPGYMFAMLGVTYYSLSVTVFGVASRKFPIARN